MVEALFYMIAWLAFYAHIGGIAALALGSRTSADNREPQPQSMAARSGGKKVRLASTEKRRSRL